MQISNRKHNDLLWRHISELPYFRGFLRAVESRFFQDIEMMQPTLDLGCGDGHFAARTFKKKIDFGIDPSEKVLRSKYNRAAYETVLCCEGNRIPFLSNSFSTVISNSVLEHIKDVDSVIEEIFRILKPGGIVLLTVPNSNFTKNLSIATMFEKIRLPFAATLYRNFFNAISRHYHPDPGDRWMGRLKRVGFNIISNWNYFPKKSLRILEWGHYFGLPNLINKFMFGRWILFKNSWYVALIHRWLHTEFIKDQKAQTGAYTFIIAKKE